MSYEIKSVACRKSFTDTLLELGRQDKNIVAVTTDARGSVTLTDFAKQLPEQFVECGIAEQDAVGIAAGLASCGKKVLYAVRRASTLHAAWSRLRSTWLTLVSR